jgi:hypothetical protein
MDRFRSWIPFIVALPCITSHAEAAEEDDLEALRRRMDELQRKSEEEMRALRGEVERLRAAKPGAAGQDGLAGSLEDYLDRLDDVEDRVAGLDRPRSAVRLLDISFNALFAAGASTATEDEIDLLQGGAHDPKRRGFTIQNTELGLSGAVDPYFRGDAFIIFQIDGEGETVVELEEAFLTTTSLPAGLQLRVGQFFTEFGRLNSTHPHSWEFVDQPVVNTRMFGGDGMRGPGARLSWLTPASFPLEFLLTAQNANGETMASFVSEEPPDGRPAVDRPVRTIADMVWTARAHATADLAEDTVLRGGVSGAFGPNSSGSDGRTRILGADVTLRWKPAGNDRGFPFVTWQTEAMTRRYAASTFSDPLATPSFLPGETLTDRGAYSQVTWGFRRDWALGARYDFADGRGGGHETDPFRDRRVRASVALTHYFSEFSKLRLEVNRDRAGHMDGDATSVWLQWEITLGAHGAHNL